MNFCFVTRISEFIQSEDDDSEDDMIIDLSKRTKYRLGRSKDGVTDKLVQTLVTKSDGVRREFSTEYDITGYVSCFL